MCKRMVAGTNLLDIGWWVICRLLALCAHLAAVLPYKRADEPLVVVHHINLVVSRRGEDVLSALKASLTDSSAATV